MTATLWPATVLIRTTATQIRRSDVKQTLTAMGDNMILLTGASGPQLQRRWRERAYLLEPWSENLRRWLSIPVRRRLCGVT